MPMLNGLNVILDANLVVAGAPKTRKRSWSERLRQGVRLSDVFTRLPALLAETVTYTPMEPSRYYYLLAGGSVVMHPALWTELKHALMTMPPGQKLEKENARIFEALRWERESRSRY